MQSFKSINLGLIRGTNYPKPNTKKVSSWFSKENENVQNLGDIYLWGFCTKLKNNAFGLKLTTKWILYCLPAQKIKY